MSNNTNYIDVINNIVTAMRETGSIVSIVDNADGTYTVTVDDIKSLADKEWLTFSGTTNFNKQYAIYSISGDTFKINETKGYASETGTWTANAPYIIPGHLIDVNEQLTEKDEAPDYKNQKFPLIILALDAPEQKGIPNTDSECEVNLMLCTLTEQNWNVTERRTNNFDPILQPLYDKFIEKLLINKDVRGSIKEDFLHVKTDAYNLGKTQVYGNAGLLTRDRVDAIIIEGLPLKIYFDTINCN